MSGRRSRSRGRGRGKRRSGSRGPSGDGQGPGNRGPQRSRRPVSAKQKREAMKLQREKERQRAQREAQRAKEIREALARGEMPEEVAIWRSEEVARREAEGFIPIHGGTQAESPEEALKKLMEERKNRSSASEFTDDDDDDASDSVSRTDDDDDDDDSETVETEASDATDTEASRRDGHRSRHRSSSTSGYKRSGKGRRGRRRSFRSDSDTDSGTEEDEDWSRRRRRHSSRGERREEDESRFQIPDTLKAYVPGDLRTVFARDTREEIMERRLQSQLPLDRSKLEEVEEKGGIVAEDYFSNPMIRLPHRPPWESHWTKREAWLRRLYETYSRTRLNHFEHNLEVWRQLWRTIERSDVLLCLADARNPLLNFPPSLWELVVGLYRKPLIVVINKVDLVLKDRVQEWIDWLKNRFPDVTFIPYTSHPHIDEHHPYFDPNEERTPFSKSRHTVKPFGAEELLEAIKQTTKDDFPSEVWEKISFRPTHLTEGKTKIQPRRASDTEKRFVTIGLLGPPNAGKSTFINSLAGRKVVSVSRTPGHTKYLQTMFLNPQTCLCDCPGIVFPAVDMPRALQVIFGLYPIAQLREPYSVVKYLAEHLPLEKILGLPKVYPDKPWSGWEICEAYAAKKNYRSRKGVLDAYRAANEILRRVHEGKIRFNFIPAKDAKIADPNEAVHYSAASPIHHRKTVMAEEEEDEEEKAAAEDYAQRILDSSLCADIDQLHISPPEEE